MSPGDGIDDGKAEAAPTPPASLVRPGEALERVREEAIRKAGPFIGHTEPPSPVPVASGQADRAGSVTQRGVDHVPERLCDTHRVRGQHQPRSTRHLELAAGVRHASGVTLLDSSQPLGGVDRGQAHRQPSVVGAGDDQQLLGEQGQTIGLGGRGAQGVIELSPTTARPQRQLELGLEDRQRRSQLVARV